MKLPEIDCMNEERRNSLIRNTKIGKPKTVPASANTSRSTVSFAARPRCVAAITVTST